MSSDPKRCSCSGGFASLVHVYPLSQVRLRFSGDTLATPESVDAPDPSVFVPGTPMVHVHRHWFMMPADH